MSPFLPSTFWSVVTGSSLIGWIVAVVLMTWNGVRPDGSFAPRRGFRWLAIFVILYIMWILGITRL
jgi:hypothetical protein